MGEEYIVSPHTIVQRQERGGRGAMSTPQDNEKPATCNDGFSKGFGEHCGGVQPNPTSRLAQSQGFPKPRARRNSTGGTAEAAAQAASRTSGLMAATILAVLERAGKPMSAEELRTAMIPMGFGGPVQSWRARCSDLHQLGYLADSGERGRSEAGRKSVRWAFVPEGQRVERSPVERVNVARLAPAAYQEAKRQLESGAWFMDDLLYVWLQNYSEVKADQLNLVAFPMAGVSASNAEARNGQV